VSGLPSGTTAAFEPGACDVPCAVTLTIAASGATLPGAYPLTVSGQPFGRGTTVTLVIARTR
jgi:hypothetical protein